ncbi:MAG: TetR family transcriptional regulator [Aeromicrobium sp.]|nr:TetR family transcriptional regulator [Aeromicrobium sp.]
MSEISDRADSTKPTLYAHFGDKDGLYARLLQREAELCRTHLFAAYANAAGLPLSEQTRADVEAFFDYAATRSLGFELLFGAQNGGAVTTRDELVEALVTQIAQRLTDYVSRSTTSRPTWREHQLAAMLVGGTITAAQHARSEPGVDLDQACRLASDYAIAALKNLPRD